MAPKKSKKEKQAEKEAELARIAEEQRLEEERLAREKAEEEKRMAEELAARQKAESEAQAEFDALIEAEDDAMTGMYKDWGNKLVGERVAAFDSEDWKVFTACEPLPDVQREAEVNTFLTEWSEKPRFGADFLDKTFAECTLCTELLRSLQLEAAFAASQLNAKKAAWQKEVQLALKAEMQRKIDGATADFLQRSDEFSDKQTMLCRTVVPAEGCRFGLWVNLAKNPRNKVIHFDEPGELDCSIELPKVLALASIAVRAVHYTTDFVSPYASEAAAAASEYMTLGGVLDVDLLSLPQPAKKVKGWTMRLVNEMSHSVVRMAYPIPSSDGSLPAPGTAPALKISLKINPMVILPEKIDTVGFWDAPNEKWLMNDEIISVDFEPETRVLSFSTTCLTSLALLQPTHLELPYKKWVFTPASTTAGSFYLTTQRFDFHIDISAAGCTLRAPVMPELEGLLGVPMAAAKLVLALKARGINLQPTDKDAAKLKRITPKDAELEKKLHDALTPLVPGYQLAPSRWNQSRGPGKLCVRLSRSEPSFDADDEVAPPPSDPYAASEADWPCLEYSTKRAVLIKALDADPTCDEEPLKDGAHSTPLQCLKADDPDLLVSSSPQLYGDTVRQLFDELRPFSFTAS